MKTLRIFSTEVGNEFAGCGNLVSEEGFGSLDAGPFMIQERIKDPGLSPLESGCLEVILYLWG